MIYCFFCINLWNKFIFLKEQKFTHKNGLFNRGSKSYILQLITRTKLQQKQHCGVIEPSDIHPPFVLGLRPMPRPIIAYEEDSGNHGNPGNRAKDNSVLGQPKLRQKKSDLPTKIIFQNTPRKKISTTSKHTGAWRQSNSRNSQTPRP